MILVNVDGYWEEHELVDDIELKGEARLHRFRNRGGAEMSAIYIGDEEIWNHNRSEEKRMINDWNDWGWKRRVNH